MTDAVIMTDMVPMDGSEFHDGVASSSSNKLKTPWSPHNDHKEKEEPCLFVSGGDDDDEIAEIDEYHR